MRVCNTLIANFIVAILGLWVASFLVLISLDKADQIPTMTFSAIAAGFAYQAYKYTKEKFRLELFEKRWDIYNKVIVFQDIFLKNRGLVVSLNKDNQNEIEQALSAANDSFAKIGWHKARFLFGKDVVPFFDTLETIYLKWRGETWDEASAIKFYGTEAQKLEKNEGIEKIYETVKSVHKNFTPYLYFGDYKSNDQEKNLCELCASAVKKFKIYSSLKSRKD